MIRIFKLCKLRKKDSEMIPFHQMLAKLKCFNHFSTKDVTGTWICAVDDANT